MKIKLKQDLVYSMVVRGEAEEGFVIPGVELRGKHAVLTRFECRFLFDGVEWALSHFQCCAVPGDANGQPDPDEILSYGLEVNDCPPDQDWIRLLANAVQPMGGSWAPITEFEVSE